MVQRVRKPHRGRESFVCHSTPHFDSTSREVSYSVRMYHTRYSEKCKYSFPKTVLFIAIIITGTAGGYDSCADEMSLQAPQGHGDP